jgi:Transposase DDE domain
MTSIPQMAVHLQTLFGPEVEPIARRTGVIRRLRKFSAAILLQMLVFTLLKVRRPTTKNYVATAAQLGLDITERAVEKRFTPQLVSFLRAVLTRLINQAIAAAPVDIPLLAKFTAVLIGDSTTILLPEDCAAEFPGCGGKSGAGQAALKIQVLWDLCTGRLKRLLWEPGRHSDAQSAILQETPPAGSLSIWDLGSFSVKRFGAWAAAGAFWISRLHPGTALRDGAGQALDLRTRLRAHTWEGPLDLAILLGSTERVACRLIALRAPREVAARRRQKAYEKAQKSGRTPSREHLEWCDWTLFVTNCSEEQLTWKEVVILYRSRWQIELLFKLWKSENRLATHAAGKSVAWQMAEFWGRLIGVIVQHWLLLTTTWHDHRRSLMQAADVLREWIVVLLDALGDRDRLIDALGRVQAVIAVVAHVHARKTKPSWFQLVKNPELLEYTH